MSHDDQDITSFMRQLLNVQPHDLRSNLVHSKLEPTVLPRFKILRPNCDQEKLEKMRPFIISGLTTTGYGASAIVPFRVFPEPSI